MKLPSLQMPPQLAEGLRTSFARWQALSLRERAMVAGVVLAALVALFDFAVLQPAQRQRRVQLQRIEVAEGQVTELSNRLGAAGGSAAERLAQAQRALAEVETQLAEVKGSVTPPAQMAERLRALLASPRNLTVVAFRNLPAQGAGGEPVGATTPGAAATPDAAPATSQTTASGASTAAGPTSATVGLYRHPIEIRLLGRYTDIVAWLDRLEGADEDLHVTAVALDLRPSGKIEARVSLYTLGTEPVWLTL